MTAIDTGPHVRLSDSAQIADAARALATGAVVAHGFANFYAITTRSDVRTVRRVNQLKGRPAGQVGSLTGPPAALTEAWDLDHLPEGLSRRCALGLLDAFFALGPFGFRAPAASWVPAHLSEADGGVMTAQVIAPGYRCPSNGFLAAASREAGDRLLYITSANRSRHRTGAADSPAHWRVDGLRVEFGDHPGLRVVEHDDEVAARAAYPNHLPMSTTILALHRVTHRAGRARPDLIMERHGSLSIDVVREVVGEFGFGLELGPRARTRLPLRDYSQRLSDR